MSSAAGSERLAEKLGETLRARSLTLCVAESCTGGMLGAAITAVAGSSDYFRGGVIAYANQVKSSLLGVSPATIETHGAVSAQCAREMAAGVKRLMGSDVSIAVSGVAGPGGGTPEKPVGLVYIGLCAGDDTMAHEEHFDGSRGDVRRRAVDRALQLLVDVLETPHH